MSSSRRTVARETSLDDMKLADLSEAQLVSHFRDYFPVGERTLIGIGDDCAQIAAPEGSFIVTTDVMVEDQHFHLSWSTGYEVGARVAAQNLADIDAMGGRPTGLVASVVAPRQMDADVFLDVVRGLGDRARQVGAGSYLPSRSREVGTPGRRGTRHDCCFPAGCTTTGGISSDWPNPRMRVRRGILCNVRWGDPARGVGPFLSRFRTLM